MFGKATMASFLAVALVAGGPGARAVSDVQVGFEALGQQDVLDAGAVAVSLGVRRRSRVSVGVSIRNGQRTVRLGPTQTFVVGRGQDRRVAFELPPSARDAVEACDAPTVVVRVRVPRRRPREVDRPIGIEPPRCGRFFADASVWNQPIPPDAQLDPNSPAITAAVRREVESGYRDRRQPTVNTTPFSAPIYTVASRQPNVRVILDQPKGAARRLAERFASVPIPPDAQPAAGSDGHLVVWQPSKDRLWEFWQLRRAADGWHARWGGRLDDMSRGPGHFAGETAGWGATATSLPLLGGLITVAELRRGQIDHVLAVAVPNTRAGLFSAPAQRTDGSSRAPDATPEGARFRLDPAVDVESLGLDPVTLAMARAAQRYGIVVRDTAANIAFYAEDPGPLRLDPYPALFGGRRAGDLLRRFPWEHLQLLQMDLREEPSADPGPLGCLPLRCR